MSLPNQLCIRKAIFQSRVFDSQVLSDTISGFPPDLPKFGCGYSGWHSAEV
jgi:hypothetical protein